MCKVRGKGSEARAEGFEISEGRITEAKIVKPVHGMPPEEV